MKAVIVALVLSVMAVGIVFWALRLWAGLGEGEISGHGIFALVLGIVFSLGLGLMFLVFYSCRRGHDDDDAV